MKSWFTLAELAGLDWFPGNRQSIQDEAFANHWFCRISAGGFQVHISNFPHDIQLALVRVFSCVSERDASRKHLSELLRIGLEAGEIAA